MSTDDSETSVHIQLRTRQYIPEDSELHTRRRENLKSHVSITIIIIIIILLYVCPTIKNCPSARCASAANVVWKDFDVFRNHNVSLEHILL
jgi:hypothetical protein